MSEQILPMLFQRVQIRVRQGAEEMTYLTRIMELSGNSFLIAMPDSPGAEKRLLPGVKLDVIAIAHDGLYSLSSAIKEIKPLEGRPALVMDPPSSPKRIQRRNYQRIDLAVDVRFRMLSGPDETPSDPFTNARSKNLSGGGILLAIAPPTAVKDYVEIEILLPGRPVHTIGRVVTSKPDEAQPDCVDVAVEYLLIDTADRERIIRYVFDKQRTLGLWS
ncbi:MAG: PilZ domain-containing protein [Planctomycetota bacterium]